MPSTYLGVSNLLRNSTIYEEEKDGLATFTVKSSLSPLSSITPSLSNTIQVDGNTLRMVSVNVVSGSSFKYITEVYQGKSPNLTTQKNAINSTSEEPIQSHPNFYNPISPSGTIVQKSGGVLTEGNEVNATTGGAVFDAEGNFLYFNKDAKERLFGVSSYLAPALTFRKAFTSSTTPSILIIGKIVSGDGFPTAKSGATWLCTGVQYTQRGNTFEVSQDFRASDQRGWNEYIYGNPVSI